LLRQNNKNTGKNSAFTHPRAIVVSWLLPQHVVPLLKAQKLRITSILKGQFTQK